jgi:antitoxin component YwqK of YwqJK toxin-antitoxin module
MRWRLSFATRWCKNRGMTHRWALALLLAGCTHHSGSPGTPHGNDLILGPMGIPEFSTSSSPARCPSPNGEGKVKLTFGNGKDRVKGECKGGVMVGDWKAWYENGAVVWKASFKDGLLVGVFTSWHSNDEKMARVTFHAGVADGGFKAWHYNGQKRAEGDYVGGKKNGCWETWHDNGQKATKGAYADDQQVLTWLTWTPTGSKSKQELGGEATHGKCLITL